MSARRDTADERKRGAENASGKQISPPRPQSPQPREAEREQARSKGPRRQHVTTTHVQDSAPAALAAKALGIDAAAISSVEPIKHGLTNESWLVRSEREAVVVRLSHRAENALQIDRLSEARILAAVAAAGIGPPVLLSDPARHVLVTRYLGETWGVRDALEPDNIDRLAILLRRLHRLEVPVGIRRIDLLDTVDGYVRTLQMHAGKGALDSATMRARAHRIARTLRARSFQCLCHNDVHHLNIVGMSAGRAGIDAVGRPESEAEDPGTRALRAHGPDRQRIDMPDPADAYAAEGSHVALRLIDWEYAGLGEPLFDLASVCVSHGYSAAQRERLLASYATCRPAAGLARRLELACWLFEYVRDLWLAVREHVPA